MTSSREQFEEWAKSEHLSLAYADCGYVYSSTNSAWSAWQASRQCIEIALPEVEDPANFFCEVYDTFKIQQALTVAGIKIKGA